MKTGRVKLTLCYTGPLEIYRVPGSVSFLHSGGLLHAILPRSQCWCVDGVSTFVFRVRPDNYYRIELPFGNEQELELVEGLKATLTKVLYYERTACPFRRGFGEELPEMPEVPRRRLSRQGSVGPAKKWRFERRWRPEGAAEDQEAEEEAAGSSQSSRRNSIHDRRISDDEKTPDGEAEEAQHQQAHAGAAVKRAPLASPQPPRGNLHSMRSVTAPPQLNLQSLNLTSHPPKSNVPHIAGRINEAVRTQIQSAQTSQNTTPVRRRQMHIDALTPRLPPTPESMHDGFTQALMIKGSHGEYLEQPVNPWLEPDPEVVHEHSQDQNPVQEAVQELELESDEQKQLEARDETIKDEEETRNEERIEQEALAGDSVEPELEPESAQPSVIITPDDPDEDITETIELSTFTTMHDPLPSSHTQATTSDFDYAQDTASQTLSQTLSNTETPSPDPSIASTVSSLDSWTSLPAEPFIRTSSSTDALSEASWHDPLPALKAKASMISLQPYPGTTQTQLTQTHLKPTHSRQASRSRSRSLAQTSQALAGTGALLVKRTAQIFLGPPAHLVQLMLRIAAKIIASTSSTFGHDQDSSLDHSTAASLAESYELHGLQGNEGISLTVPIVPGEAMGIVRKREEIARIAVQEIRRRKAMGHRRVPGSFDFSDDEEEWGGM